MDLELGGVDYGVNDDEMVRSLAPGLPDDFDLTTEIIRCTENPLNDSVSLLPTQEAWYETEGEDMKD